MPKKTDLVQLAAFEQALDAYALHNLLAASGIASSITGEASNHALAATGLGFGGLIGVQIVVRREDLEPARLVMNEVPAASDVIFAEWTCVCGEDVDQGFSVCWSCGADHPDVDG